LNHGVHSYRKGLEDLPSLGRGDGRVLITIRFLEGYTGTDDWNYRYIPGTCSYVYRTKQGRKTRALWEISWFHKMCNVINKALHKPKSLNPSSPHFLLSSLPSFSPTLFLPLFFIYLRFSCYL